MKPITGLVLTPEQAEGVRLYREFVQHKRREGHLRRYYAQIDAQFGDKIDAETRRELAFGLFSQHMAEKTRTRRAGEV